MGALAVVQGEVAQPAPQPAPMYVQKPEPVYVQQQPSVVYVDHGRPMGPSLGRSVVTGVVAGVSFQS